VGNWEIISLVLTCTVLLLGAVLLMLNQTLLKLIEPLLIKFHLGGLARQFAKIQILLRSFPRQALAKSMGLSIILQLVIIYYYYLIAQQLNIPISYLQLLVFIPIIVVATLLPISLGGLGLKEGLLAYLFSRVHLSLEHAVLLSLTVTVLGWILSLPGGLILLLDTEYQAAKNTKVLKENYSDTD
jgi:hypothetical protein